MISTWLRRYSVTPNPFSFWVLTGGKWNDQWVWKDSEKWED